MHQELIGAIQTSLELQKCRHCGCMRESLEQICDRLNECNDAEFYPLFCTAKEAFGRLEAVEYT